MSPEGVCGFCFVFFIAVLYFFITFLLLLFYSCLMSVEDMQNKNLIVLHDVVFSECNSVTIKFET